MASTWMLALSGLLPLVSLFAVLPLGLYLLARWRDRNSATPDTQLGFKFVLHLFRVIAYQLLLAGLFFALGAALEWRIEMVPVALGLLVPAIIVFGVCAWILACTNEQSYPAVARLFAGYNLITTGVIGFVALVVLCQMLFQIAFARHARMELPLFAFPAVYTTAWIIQGVLFGRKILKCAPKAK